MGPVVRVNKRCQGRAYLFAQANEERLRCEAAMDLSEVSALERESPSTLEP